MLKKYNTLKIFQIFLLICLSFFITTQAWAKSPEVKNLILLIPDGTGVGATTLARWYQGGKPLHMDKIAQALVRTYATNGLLTDSAAGATAYSTGFKTVSGYVAVMPDQGQVPGVDFPNPNMQLKPMATLLEAARLKGKSTGIICTSHMQDATPASFTAHFPNRRAYEIIAEQQVYSGVDVVLGAGFKYLQKQNRDDHEDLIQQLKDQGYDYVTTPQEMKRSSSSKLWGLFGSYDLAYDLDRDPNRQPSLSEMTQKAISVLSKNPKGFFLMVEGSKVDWAAHANEPVGVVSDLLAFDQAVKIALDYAKTHQDTLVVVITDHGNGGITLGNQLTKSGYTTRTFQEFISPLKRARLTGEGLESKLNANRTNVQQVLEEYWGITDLTAAEIQSIKDAKKGKVNKALGPIISQRALIGWTSHGGHTGEEVILYAYGPKELELPKGVVENNEVGQFMARALNLDLAQVSRRLFVSAQEIAQQTGATYQVDETSKENKILNFYKDQTQVSLPVYKNYALVNGQKKILSGVTLFNGKNWYVPSDVKEMINQ